MGKSFTFAGRNDVQPFLFVKHAVDGHVIVCHSGIFIKISILVFDKAVVVDRFPGAYAGVSGPGKKRICIAVGAVISQCLNERSGVLNGVRFFNAQKIPGNGKLRSVAFAVLCLGIHGAVDDRRADVLALCLGTGPFVTR